MCSKSKKAKATVISLDNGNKIINQLVSEIAASKKRIEKNGIKLTTNRPRQYYFSTYSDNAEVENAEAIPSTIGNDKDKHNGPTGEHVLYPMLANYLNQEFDIYSKRINEKCSSNKRGPNGNKWLYPDLVTMEDLSHDWNIEIKDCVKEYFDKKRAFGHLKLKFLSIALMLERLFFQAVSNSSWANFSYLVAGESIDTNTLKELRILSSLHGIGLISLDKEDISESQILIPAREKTEIDWNSANRLAVENKDYLDFIKQVRHFYQTGNINKRDWITVAS